MQRELVSVVVPVYNVEQYLERCLNSIAMQTYQNLEIILVDDGSTDRSSFICDEWSKKDKRIKVIHKINAGLGEARNTGIQVAKGKYICFVDSDDFIEKNAIEKTYKEARLEKADITVFGIKIIDSNNRVKQVNCIDKKRKYQKEKIKLEFIPDMISHNPKTGEGINTWMSACTVLYSAEFIKKNNWKFVSERDIISEDVYSLLCLYDNLECAVIIPDALYCYCQNNSSLTRTYRKDRYIKIKDFYYKCLEVCDKSGYSQEIQYRLAIPFLNYTIAAMKQIVLSDNCLSDKLIIIKDIINDSTLQAVLAEHKKDKNEITKKIIYYFFRKKYVLLIYILVRAKVKNKNI